MKINTSILFLAIFLSFSANVLAQYKEIDSLKNELEIHKKQDTTRVNLLYELAFSHFQKDMNLTNSYIKEAEAISNNLDYNIGKADLLSLKGIIESRKSNYEVGLDYFQKSLKIFESLGNKKGIASSYNSIGLVHLQQSNNKEALIYLKKSFAIYEEMGNKNKLVAGYLNLGNIYSKTGSYTEAISFYKKSLALSKEIDHEYGVPYALTNLGQIYAEQGNIALALDHYNQGLLYKQKAGDTLGMAITLNSLGNIYRSIGNFEKALEYHNKSLNFALKNESKDLIAINKGNIGLIYKRKKEYKKALELMNESLDISKEIKDLGQEANCLNYIGEVNLLLKKPSIARESFEKSNAISLENNDQFTIAHNYLGIAESYLDEKQYKKSLSYTLKGNKIAKELNFLDAQHKALKLLSSNYENAGNYKKAFESHQQFKKVSDSLFNKENIEKITQLEYEYKYKQQLDSASIRELKLTKTVQSTSQDLETSQRSYLLAIIGVLLLSILLGAIIFSQKLKNAKSKTENIVMEQKLLRSQMTPHFIFNSLSVLQGMILNKEEKKAVYYLSKFSKLLRITLENSRDKMVSLSQELTAIQDYLTLQNLENEAYNYTVLVDENINIPTLEVPPMLIQPFVENAIEHAFINQKENRKIDIRLTYSNKKLICTISDNGVGINYENGDKRKDKKSLATTITSERLKILSKDLNMKGSVMVEDRQIYSKQGTIVTLEIPYKII